MAIGEALVGENTLAYLGKENLAKQLHAPKSWPTNIKAMSNSNVSVWEFEHLHGRCVSVLEFLPFAS